MAQAVVVDEWGIVREGLARLLEQAGVDAPMPVATATAGCAAVAEQQPELLVLGSCADSTPVDAVRRASGLADDLRIVALVSTADQGTIMDLFEAGADAVVPRAADVAELVDAIDHARSGRRYLAPALLTAMFTSPQVPLTPTAARCGRLTEREHAVLRLVAGGRTNREVADSLCIGAETVKTHLSSIYTKLSVNRRQAAVGVAIQQGLL
jgi:DNA-binding NarL/FixJ family response regulator